MLAPNTWDPAGKSLTTVVTLDDETAAGICIREVRSVPNASNHRPQVTVRTLGQVTPHGRTPVRAAVRRILRLDEDLSPFHNHCRKSTTHRRAATLRFGRLIRSASLFEDMIKVICTCNITWRQTVVMVDRIVARWGVPASDGQLKGFPTPRRLAALRPAQLKRGARVGYRSEFIHRLARDVVDGGLDLKAIQKSSGSADALFRLLRRIHGFGDYAAGQLCMLMGHYNRLAVDTELMRHLKLNHRRRRFTPARAQSYYVPWHPYQFLAYWYELWSGYQARNGRADSWSPDNVGPNITLPRKPPLESRTSRPGVALSGPGR